MAYVDRDWAWDQFDLQMNQSEIDILNDSALQDSGLTREDQLDYETDFIDDLYGTNDAQWTGEGKPKDYGGTGGSWQDIGALNTRERRRDSYLNVDTTLWGLDLVRVDKEALELGTPEHYQHITRGEVDWAHYYTSNAYQEAFKEFQKGKTFAQRHSTLESYLTAYESGPTRGRKDAVELQSKVDFIREANEAMGQSADDKDKREEPKGEYDADNIRTETDDKGNTHLFIDGERQPTLSERYNTIDPETGERSGRLEIGFTATRKDEDGNDVEYTVGPKGKLSKSAFDPIAGPPSPVVKPQINIPNVKVKVPDSLRQWKTLAKETLKVGGNK